MTEFLQGRGTQITSESNPNSSAGPVTEKVRVRAAADSPLADGREEALPGSAAVAVVVGPVLLLQVLDGRAAG